jgi:uncharacterized protein YeaO (DUF488 family)
MGHPLTPDLSKLTTEELTNKYNELSKRIGVAYRMGQSDAVFQLQLFMEDYQAEMNERNRKAMEELETKTKQFKHIIDIQ